MSIYFFYFCVVVFLIQILMTALITGRQVFMSLFVRFTNSKNVLEISSMTNWPDVTIIIPAHNEEKVISGGLETMLNLDYPADRLTVLLINDRSTDRTGEIADQFASRYPSLKVLHRAMDAKPGKPEAIQDAVSLIDSDILIFFDADYLPQPALLKRLVAPFADPEVGAIMGRVVTYNTNANLLTRLVDLERRAGYVVDQQARSLLHLLPQFGGTVGGIRLAALESVGGWRGDSLTEDTDITYRMFLDGWTVEYLNEAVCAEESPETWDVRFKQVRRWAFGHNQCLARYFLRVLHCSKQSRIARFDAAIVLLFYIYPAFTCLALALSLIYPLFYDYPPFHVFFAISIAFFTGYGNMSPYYQILVAAQKDRQLHVLRSLPLLYVSSAISMMASVSALFEHAIRFVVKSQLGWDKTTRFRSAQ